MTYTDDGGMPAPVEDWPDLPSGWEPDDTDPTDRHASTPRLGKVLSRSELSTLPRVRPLVAGLLSQPSAAVLIGSYGTGKSILAHGLACSVATGHPWLGREVQRRRVLLVVGEGAWGLDDRLAAWENAWQEGRPVPDADLSIIPKPGSLAAQATWLELMQLATAEGYGFIVLDTFSSLAPDADETKDAARIMRHVSDLAAQIDGTVLLVHHPGWGDSNRARGGYQIEANADEVLVIAGVPDEPLVKLTRKKVKEAAAGDAIWLRRKSWEPSVIFTEADATSADAPNRARIVQVLEDRREVGATGPQLATELGYDKVPSGFYGSLRKLQDDGAVKATGSRGRSRYYLSAHAPEDAT